MENTVIYTIFGIAILIVIFLFIREVVCWYFKLTIIYESLENLNKTNKLIVSELTNANMVLQQYYNKTIDKIEINKPFQHVL